MAQAPEDIDRIARSICENLGFDPNETEKLRADEYLTAREYEDHVRGKTYTQIAEYLEIFGPRWKNYRRRASEALAVKAALGL